MSTRKKILTQAGTVSLCVLVALAAVMLLLHAFASSGKALPGGYRPLVVLSGSMEPAVPVGSIVLAKSVDPIRVQTGDIITFALTPDMSGRSVPFATHRVAQVLGGSTARNFVTKGDANTSADATPVPAERLIGKVVLVVPYVGYLSRFVQSPFGLILMILLPGAVLVIWEGIDLIRRRTKVPQTVLMVAVVLMLCFVGAGQAGNAAGSETRTATRSQNAAVVGPSGDSSAGLRTEALGSLGISG